MLIVGDIGGTKTLLASVNTVTNTSTNTNSHLDFIKAYQSYNYANFEIILDDYLTLCMHLNKKITAIGLAVAGPVTNNNSNLTNLKWSIVANQIKQKTNVNKVYIYNDLEAIAAAICYDYASVDITALKNVAPLSRVLNDYTVKAIIAPGTGLGVSYIVSHKNQYMTLPSQGGHISFAPKNQLQYELLEYLQLSINNKKDSQIGLELVCSGIGIANIFYFFKDYKKIGLDSALNFFDSINSINSIGSKEIVPIIIKNAISNSCELCCKTINLFMEILAQAIQTVALTIYATGGIYLAGGIALALKEYLQCPQFLSKIMSNSTMAELLDKFPIYLCENKNIALLGASKLVNLNSV